MQQIRELIILLPVFNDWTSCQRLLSLIDQQLAPRGITARVLIVDDGSTDSCTLSFEPDKTPSLQAIDVVELRRNLGHQRAIAIGLVHIATARPDLPVLLLDSDGEDKPEDIPALLECYAANDGGKAVFAGRTRRSESIAFRIGYHSFKLLHQVLVGTSINQGNFSVLPPRIVQQLIGCSELWNHYAASLMKARLPFTSIPTTRGKRLDGSSKMKYTALVLHGLSAFSVYSDLIGVRVLTASIGLLGVITGAFVATLVVRFSTHLAIPGWTTLISGILLIFGAQIVSTVTLFVFMVLHQRSGPQFMPMRDCPLYIARCFAVQKAIVPVDGARAILEGAASRAMGIGVGQASREVAD